MNIPSAPLRCRVLPLAVLSLCASLPVWALDSVVVFNEVNYNPAPGHGEFIELHNLQGVDVNLGGWRVTGGVDFAFPDGTVIPGHGYLLLGTVPGAFGAFSGALDNGGETIRLKNRNGRVMDELSYDDEGEWPVGPDGSGATLARIADMAVSGPGAWRASQQIGGTPGVQNFALPGSRITTAVQGLTEVWSYDASGVEPGTAWRTAGFDDSAWAMGTAPFFYGTEQPAATPSLSINTAGVWSVERWTGDADSQIDAGKTYTHKVDLGHTGTATVVNGVTFDNHQTAAGAGTVRTGTNWTLSGAVSNYTTNSGAPRNTMAAGSGSQKLLTEFYYGSSTAPEVLQLSGLSAGEYYTLTFYCTGWDTREVRPIRMTPDNTGTATVIDEGAWGQGKGILVKYRYRAPESGSLTITLEPEKPAAFYQYAFTNEVSAALPAEAAIAGGVTVAGASSAVSTRPAAATVDGSGLTDSGGHGTVATANMWLTTGTSVAPNDPLPADITWDLGAATTLTGMRVWNYNELTNPTGTVSDLTNRGVRNVEVLVSPDAAGANFTSAGTWEIPQAFGVTTEIGTRMAFAVPQKNVRRVKFNVTTNWGGSSEFAGLSEVQFLTPGTELPANPVTARFRKTFTLTGSPDSLYQLNLQYAVDDGAVFYVNGTEVHRVNLSGAVSATTPADSSVTAPAVTSLAVPVSALVSGTNILAVELHQAAAGMDDAYFAAGISVVEIPQTQSAGLVFNEISGASDAAFYVELRNTSGSAVDTSGWAVRSSTGQTVALPAQSVPAGGFLTLNAAALGFTPADGAKLFLVSNGGLGLQDARTVTSRPRGLTASGIWGHPTSATPGAANVIAVSDAVVINELFYHGLDNSPEQWIELYNKSAAAVDISGWKFSDGVSWDFVPGTVIPAGGYLVVAWDPAAFASLHPGKTALGPWRGSLSGKGELVRLRDAEDNIADEFTYSGDGQWPDRADGGGSSLELRDPRADNRLGPSWAASDETRDMPWQTYSLTGTGAHATTNNFTYYHEFVMGLLDAGEILIDDISLKEVTNGNRELIQNGDFSGGNADKWRNIGTHRFCEVVEDPSSPGNKVLKLVATGATEHMNNHCETTLKAGSTYVTTSTTATYTLTFRAKWLGGTNRLHTRLYFNRFARQTLLPRPATGGTPGAVNTAFTNAGPDVSALAVAPVVPGAGEGAAVTVVATDPDGIAQVQLLTSVNGAAFSAAPMSGSGGVYTGSVPGQSAGALVQFYVRAVDTAGKESFYPPAGPDSRAMIPWDDGKTIETMPGGCSPHNLRIVMPAADANDMYLLENVHSNWYRPCTVIMDGRQVWYEAGTRLKSSEHGRFQDNRVGFNLKFGEDNLFLGVHTTVSVDRSGNRDTTGIDGTGISSQREILVKAVMNNSGGIYSVEDDLIRVIPTVAAGSPAPAYTGATLTGEAILTKSRFDDEYLDDQFSNGGDGPWFKQEYIYPLSQTINPTTRAVSSISGTGTLNAVAENPKIPQTGGSPGPTGINVQYYNPPAGMDAKENFRWHWLLRNARGDDDYSGLIAAVTAVGKSGTAFTAETAAALNVDVWLRAAVVPQLFGVVDNYLGSGATHNFILYFPPGEKGVAIPWDSDYFGQSSTSAGITAGGQISKFIANPVNKRRYYGHVLDILNTSFNDAFLTRWATHYSCFGADDITSNLAFLRARATYVRNLITGSSAPVKNIAFGVTSANPATVSEPVATITGDGWIDVEEIRLQGVAGALEVAWTDDNSWALQLPVGAGAQDYVLEAVRKDGTIAGSATVNITGTGSVIPATAANLVVSELHYHPADPGVLEALEGYTSADDFEFIELQNISTGTVDLTNCRFDAGITYAFAAGTQIAPGGRLVLPRRAAAFAIQHPGVATAPEYYDPANPTGNQFSNGGETVAIVDALGVDIKRFSYDDAAPWPAAADGNGPSLVLIAPAANPAHGDALSWRASSGSGGNPGDGDALSPVANALGDDNGDGIVNLLAWAAGGSPDVSMVGGAVSITRESRAGAVITLECSDDLLTWQDAALDGVVRTALTGTRERLDFVPVAVPGSVRRYYRFAVTQ